MKKLYTLFFSFFWLLGFSQSYASLLSNVDWKIVKIQWNNTDYAPPSPLSQNGRLKFNYPATLNYMGTFFNSVGGDFVFGENNENYFNVLSHAITLAMYGGENEQAVNQFDGMSTSFYFGFPKTSNFYFDYQETSAGKSLVVTNPAGNKIFYSDAILATSEVSKSKISVYPNPATDVIILENLKPNSSLELIDNSGKLVKMISNKSSREEIDIKNLIPGIYYLKADGKMIQKIIKK